MGACRAIGIAAFTAVLLMQPAAENSGSPDAVCPIIAPAQAGQEHASGGCMLVPRKVRLIIRYVSIALA